MTAIIIIILTVVVVHLVVVVVYCLQVYISGKPLDLSIIIQRFPEVRIYTCNIHWDDVMLCKRGILKVDFSM